MHVEEARAGAAAIGELEAPRKETFSCFLCEKRLMDLR